MSYVLCQHISSHVLFHIDVFVVLLVIKILMFLLVGVAQVWRHKTVKHKYYVNPGSSSWKSLSAIREHFTSSVAHDGLLFTFGLCPAVTG